MLLGGKDEDEPSMEDMEFTMRWAAIAGVGGAILNAAMILGVLGWLLIERLR